MATPRRIDQDPEMRKKLSIGKYAASDTVSAQHYGTFLAAGIDNSLTLESFKENIDIKVKSIAGDEMIFDIIGIDASLANAFRRIMLSEVPTMAIENVFFEDNTSIVVDEMVAHRLGLIPIKADPREYDFRGEDRATQQNTIVFKLDCECYKNEDGDIVNDSVYSKDLVHLNQGSELPRDADQKFTKFETKQKTAVRPVDDDILLARLRPGQRIKAECHAVKGIGATHAKWSPVATAFYRLMPSISITGDLTDREKKIAQELEQVCPAKVFDIEDGDIVAARERDCTMCRECIRQDGWEKKVKLEQIKDHFIFSIESTGCMPPQAIFSDAIKILAQKCTLVLDNM